MPKHPRSDNVHEDEGASLADLATEHTDVLPPTPMVGGKYRLGRLLGEGGMGSVYAAEHTGLGVRVAVKLLSEAFTTDPSAVSRFRREARAAAAIRHPNIVEVTDTGTDEGGVPFIVMELLDGESLSSLLRRERVLSPAVAVLIGYQILLGLAAAHDKGVIHRDLKPGNILLARNPDGTFQVKILDFGISKFFGTPSHDVTATGAVIGTPRFMAPEQAKGQSDLDARVDIYAVGVLLFRMVTGKLPFAARTQEEIIRAILEGRYTPPRQIKPEIPAELERVICKAMAADRAQRYPDARTMLYDLQQAMPDATLGGTVQITAHTGLTAGPTPINLSGSLSAPSLYPTGYSLGEPSTRPASPHALRGPARGRPYWIVAAAVVVLLGGVLGWYFATRDQQGTASDEAKATYDGPVFRFGITRYLPESQLESEHQALVKYLAQRLQRPVELKIHDDYVDMSAQLAKGQLDLAALSSYAYVRAKRKSPGLKLLATHVTTGGTSYEGYVVVKADSGIENLLDLKGKVFCYVGPNSSSGYLYPRALFRRAGMDPDQSFSATRLTGDHLSALRALENGACDGAAVFAGIFYEGSKHGLPPQKFAIRAATQRIPYDAYCVPPMMPQEMIRSVRDALLALEPGSELARMVLGRKSRITGFAPVKDSAYDSVRKIEGFLDNPAKASPRALSPSEGPAAHQSRER